MKVFAIIPSGGTGQRFGGTLPKQYVLCKGKEILSYTLDIFLNNEMIDEIIIPAQPDYFHQIHDILKKSNHSNKNTKVVEGGNTRQDSVFNALSSISAKDDDLILVHDAARPLLSQNILNNALNSAISFDNVTVAIKARDTLLNGGDFVVDYIDRSKMYYVQTPQIFRYSVLKFAMELANISRFQATD